MRTRSILAALTLMSGYALGQGVEIGPGATGALRRTTRQEEH